MTTINKDTTLCISLAARPSNYGTRFHNYLYQALGLNFIYKAFTTSDLPAAVNGIRALGIRGCGVSMPYKEACIPLVDELDPSAASIQSINTIVNTEGSLKAYNTDYIAIVELLKLNHIPTDYHFALRGSGGMAKAVACALRDLGFKHGTIVAQNPKTGPALAEQCGFSWQSQLTAPTQLLINATPIGMAGGNSSEQQSFTDEQVADAETIFEVVATPLETPLIRAAQRFGKKSISGADIYAIQAVEQFALYTDHRPSAQLFQQAAAYARGEA
ncbi:shikimate 5-dehydrogenase [Celerinatantimonas sp. YJH-8]|uniref:shikimate 5-dehydrogenase n=1 Tax=Celerinatantimonas sp. YJH-8 TaxID=3228714 RepID=UPI0038C52412